jgi:hypothetical protein
MPTILRIGPYRFFFYAGDRNEPQHIHVEETTMWQNFGSFPSDCKAAADLREEKLIAYIK